MPSVYISLSLETFGKGRIKGKPIQMKAQSTIYFFVALLPSIVIYANEFLESCSKDVMKIAKEGGLIENIFQPTGDQPLDIGQFAFVFKGIFHPIPKEIAMKFTPWSYRQHAQKEYEMYSYLNATGNADVERYGIPSVYYYGTWNENQRIMLGISLLDRNIDDLQISFKNDVNVLIILRDFILSSKYMHSHGVRHDDIKPTNIMVRKHRSFLTDFHASSKMTGIALTGTPDFASRLAHTQTDRYPKDDWESFLYSMCYTLGASFEWIGLGWKRLIPELKANTTDTIEKIKTIRSETLKNILVKFAEHVFEDDLENGSKRFRGFCSASKSKSKRIPDYDHFYRMVNAEIERLILSESEPAMFTWLTQSEREEAKADLVENPTPDITKIKHPKKINFSKMKYRSVDFEKFTQAYNNWKPSSCSSPAQNSISSNKLGKKTSKKCGSLKDKTTD